MLLTVMLYVHDLFYLSLKLIYAMKLLVTVWKKLCGCWCWNTRWEIDHQVSVFMWGHSRFTHQLSLQKPLVFQLNITHLQSVLHIWRFHYQHSCWQYSGSSLRLTSVHWQWLVWSCLLLESSPHHSHFLFCTPTGSLVAQFQWLGWWMLLGCQEQCTLSSLQLGEW